MQGSRADLQRLLVTGGLGFIGSNFVRRIVNGRDTLLLNLDAGTYGSNPVNLTDLGGTTSYTLVKADLVNVQAVEKVVARVDAIIHFAAQTHVDRSISNPKSFVLSNVLGTFNLLEAARRSDVRKFVHISTDEVYGSAVGKSFVETDQLNPSSPYAASKAAGEMLVEAYCNTYGLHTVVLRCTNNFGPYQFPEKFIPKTVISALQGRGIPIYGDGKQIRDWIFVTDFCSAAEVALERAPAGSVYNVSAGNEIQNVEVAKLVLERLGKPVSLLQFVEDRPGHDYRYSLDASRIRNELGWKPMQSFTEGLAQTVDWYVRNEAWWQPLISEKMLSAAPWKESW